MQHWWWWFMLTRIALCKEDIPYGITEYKSQDYLNLPSTDSNEPDTDNWKQRSISDIEEEEIANHDSWENKRSIEYINDEIPKWGVQQHFELPYSESKRSFKFLPKTKEHILSNNFRELHYPEIEIKRVKPAFSSWGGKRSSAVVSWGGKRKPAFSSWGGKRSQSFSSWGGKRDASSYLSEQQPVLFQGWDGSHTTNSSTLNTNNLQYTEKVYDERNISDISHQFQNGDNKQKFISNWDSKRGPSFSSWGGKRIPIFPSPDEVNTKTFPLTEYYVETPEGSQMADYKDNNYKLNEGILTSNDHQIFTNKGVKTFSKTGINENLLSSTSGGKRIPAFSSWGGKRATAFSSWGGKRAPVFSSWGGKRAPAFSSWGGKRHAEEEDKNINIYNDHQELPLINDSEQVSAVSPNILFKENTVHPLELDGKRSDMYPLIKAKLYPAFSSTGGKRGRLVASDISKQSIPIFTNWHNKRTPVLSRWYSNTVQTFPKSGKRRPVFSSWGGKRNLDTVSNIEKPVTSSEGGEIQSDHVVYKRAADTEEYTKQYNEINDETKFYTQVMKHLNHESRNDGSYLPKDILIKEKKGCMTNKHLLDFSKGIISMCGMKRTQVGETKRVFQKMLLRGNGFKDITWPTIRSNSRGADFYAWGGK